MIYETFFLGLVLALLYTELTDITPGGIVVPAYLALHLDHPLRILTTVAAAALSLLAFRFLRRRMLLFGRRRFVLLLLIGSLLSQAISLLLPRLGADPLEFRVIGWVIPGLLANNLERQRFLPTMASLGTVIILTAAAARVLRALI